MTITDWIQASTTVVLAFLTWRYVVLTKKISDESAKAARAALEQVEISARAGEAARQQILLSAHPSLDIDRSVRVATYETHFPQSVILRVQNVGVGVALEVRASFDFANVLREPLYENGCWQGGRIGVSQSQEVTFDAGERNLMTRWREEKEITGTLAIEYDDVFDGRWVARWPITIKYGGSVEIGPRTVISPYNES